MKAGRAERLNGRRAAGRSGRDKQNRPDCARRPQYHRIGHFVQAIKSRLGDVRTTMPLDY
jgi:hypothetical protein